jgi:molecular chaperone DnaK (HSP70)
MSLFRNEKTATSVDGRTLPLRTLISETLKYISSRAIERLKETIGIYNPDKVRWVLTVPALWSEENKLFMRQAAVDAGIITHSNSEALLLCLEPEGAAIQLRQEADNEVKKRLCKDTIIMVLDCGGGTIDITVNKLLCDPDEQFLSEEVLPSSGGCEWGSQYVDKAFEEFLHKFFGDELYDTYLKCAMSRLDILKHFESLKRKFLPGNDDKTRLKLNYLHPHLTTEKISELVQNYNSKIENKSLHLQQKGSSNIMLPPELMKSFYDPLFANIKNKVAELLNETYSKTNTFPKFIFMIGGFSESPYLKEEIKKTFDNNPQYGSNLEVLISTRPQCSVIRGACLFGLNPRVIISRIAKKTYGINTLTEFDPDKHPESKKKEINGEYFCQDVFDVFVRKGQSVRIDESITKIYCPVRAKQTVMKIVFYCTDKKDVEFINEDGVFQLGALSIDIGKAFQTVEEKMVKVTLMFGSTHIKAIATNKDSTEERKCEFEFDAS